MFKHHPLIIRRFMKRLVWLQPMATHGILEPVRTDSEPLVTRVLIKASDFFAYSRKWVLHISQIMHRFTNFHLAKVMASWGFERMSSRHWLVPGRASVRVLTEKIADYPKESQKHRPLLLTIYKWLNWQMYKSKLPVCTSSGTIFLVAY